MMQLAIFSFLVGAVFGLRFKVIAVLPLMVIGGCLIIGASSILGQSIAAALLGVLAFGVSLQAGYVFGSFTRFNLVAMRTRAALAATVPAEPVRQVQPE